jgi:hypothetical protein
VREGRVVGEVIDAHQLDVGALSERGPEEVPADTAEPIDAYPDGHVDSSPSPLSRRQSRRAYCGAVGDIADTWTLSEYPLIATATLTT